MNQKVSIGVIGASFGQHVLVPALRSDPRCVVSAICARKLDRVKEIATKLNIPAAYEDPQAMIDDRSIDAVAIAVPPHAQPALIEAAAGAGKHLYCEKPVGLSCDDAGPAVRAAQQAGVVSSVDFIFPEIPAWQQAREMLKSGELGAIRHAAISWRVETRAYATPTENWKTRADQGGGTLLNLVSHSAYYIEWLLGGIDTLAAQLRAGRIAPEVDAGVEAQLRIAGTHVALSVAADSFMGTGHRIEIYGDDASLLLRNESADYVNGFELLTAKRGEGRWIQRAAPQSTNIDGRITAAASIARRFLDGILDHKPVVPGLVQGLRAQKLLDAMRASSQNGAWLSVKE